MAQVRGENRQMGQRLLDCRIEDGHAYLWIHGTNPQSKGWEIWVDPAEFMAALWGDRDPGDSRTVRIPAT